MDIHNLKMVTVKILAFLSGFIALLKVVHNSPPKKILTVSKRKKTRCQMGLYVCNVLGHLIRKVHLISSTSYSQTYASVRNEVLQEQNLYWYNVVHVFISSGPQCKL